jgi:hypothetical protein
MAPEMSRVWSFPAGLIRWVGSRYRRRVDGAGIQRPNTYLQSFSPEGPRAVPDLLSVLDGARDGWISELLTHPGYDGDWREEELRTLLAPEIAERLAEPDIELVTFAVVAAAERTEL